MYIQKEVFTMLTAKVFQSGNSQAIRIPGEMRTSEKEFFISQIGNGYYLVPTDDPWFLLRNSLGMAPDEEFEREQPSLNEATEREAF